MNGDSGGHPQYTEALGAYVLGAMPDDELRDVERHLEGCERCRQEVAQLQLGAEVLPGSVPPMEPPLELKERIMGVVTSEAQLLAAAGPEADRASADRRSRRRRLLQRPVATGAAAVALAGAVAAGIVVIGGPESPQPGGRVIAARITDRQVATGARASVQVAGGRASLLVQGLPDPPTRRVYQVWVKPRARSPVPAGATFAVRSGSIEIPRPVRAGDQVMVTVEPVGGSPRPTRPPLIVAAPV